jgi:hypothetical protein
MLVAATTTAWAATSPKTDVLTYTKVKGTDVALKSALSAKLAPGKSAFSLSFSAEGVAVTITCTSATLSSTVTTNSTAAISPARPSTAVTSLPATSEPTGCTAAATDNGKPVSNVSIDLTQVKFTFPATEMTFSDAAKLPVTVAVAPGAKAKYAVELSLSAKVTYDRIFSGTVACGFESAKITGAYTNTGPEITFKNQTIGPNPPSGSTDNCTTSANIFGVKVPRISAIYNATFGPVNDTSVKGSPHVYVN